MYKALFALGYYGLMRVGKLTESPHTVKAANIHMATNKKKILIMLYSSKTHGMCDRPQTISITSNVQESYFRVKHNFCPFLVLQTYIQVRDKYYDTEADQLFVFSNGDPVKPNHAREVLRTALCTLGLNETLYDMHSLRIGCTTDMAKFKYSLEELRKAGRWRSNVVLKYIRHF